MKSILRTFSFGVGGVVALLAVGMMFPRAAHALVATLIQNVDEPGRNPFAFQTTGIGTTPAFTVPTGKRYVIQTYSADCFTNPGEQGDFMDEVTVNAGTGGTRAVAFAQGFQRLGVANEWLASGTTQLYADQGTSIEVLVDGFGVASCTVGVSGYSVSTP